MAGWAGFSDEELRKMKRQSDPSGDRESNRGGRGGIQQARGARRPAPQKRTPSPRQYLMQKLPPLDTTTPVSAEQMLSQPVPMSPKVQQNGGDQNRPEPLPGTNLSRSNSVEKNKENTIVKILSEEEEGENSAAEVKEIDEGSGVSRDLSNLEKFQVQQKQMEELNKRKKEILYKAITERKKKAKAEACKLTVIQKELDHLEQLVSVDVRILRNKIEESSREYLEAQKRYERAEREFIAAKIDLHGKSEMKEQLTEHLFTIIHQNEVRKSKKLGELMHQLEMEVAAEEAELKMADVPSVALLNPIQTPVSPKALHVEKPSTEKTTTCEPPKNSEADTASIENDKTIEGKTNDSVPEVPNGPISREVAPSIDGVENEITTKPEEKGSQSDITGTTVVAKEPIIAESQSEAGQAAITAGT